MRTSLRLVLALALTLVCGAARAAATIPRYDHIFVIVEENKNYAQILDPAAAPHIAALARRYGNATHFYAEVHPSEANYVAILGGDTFGIHDDDGFTCKAGDTDPFCGGSREPGYADHTVRAPHLGMQLEAAGLTWKGYYESLPAPGYLGFIASDPAISDGTRKTALYASKHSGFLNFAQVQTDPRRSERIVGFDQLDRDLASGRLPSFALIVPNQCNEMHGLSGPRIPPACSRTADLIRQGDKVVGELVTKIQATRAWRSAGNFAIVVTFDEGSGGTREGCCAVTPGAPSNFGGGHIPTIVATNHGPRGLADPKPYNHYSLLRTLEEAFRVKGRLRHAADTDKGVAAMTPLFAVSAVRIDNGRKAGR
ncbi:MAG: alkaline phosphatase family protein [Caulobacteraceae bacterium]